MPGPKGKSYQVQLLNICEVMQMANSTCRSLGNLIKSVLKGKIVASKCFYYLRWLNIQWIKLEEQSMNRKIISHQKSKMQISKFEKSSTKLERKEKTPQNYSWDRA